MLFAYVAIQKIYAIHAMKFLIIRFSSIGDIVLTTPVVRNLKQQLPDAEIHYITKKNFKEIIESNPYVDKIHLLEGDWKNMVESLRKEQFDYIIDLHHNMRTWRIKRALKAVPAFSFHKLNYEKWLLTALKINRLPKLHIVDRYMGTVYPFGVRNDNKGLDYFIPGKDIVPVTQLPTSHQFGYIGIVIGAAHNTKKLPAHKLRELCLKISQPVILLGGPEDKDVGNTIAEVDPIKIYNACGKFNLNESADLIRNSKLIITHDTGLMHIAAAFHKPIISVWGNTVPAFGMSAYFGKAAGEDVRFEILNLWCRPCSKIGYKKCPLGHFKCMELQDIDTMCKEVSALLR
jgi:ADP-heptose:LPS heptosyltransferase